MRRTTVWVCLVLPACASSGSLEAPAEPPGRAVDAQTAGTEFHLRSDLVVEEGTIAAPADSVFVALAEVYRGLGAEIEYDPANRIIRTRNFAVSRRLAGRPVSTFIECGKNLSGHISDTARIQLEILNRLVPAGAGGTTVQTRVSANARPTSGASTSVVGCSSNGALELHIMDLARQRVLR